MRIFQASFLLIGSLLALSSVAQADEKPVFNLAIKDHKYVPDTLKVPANQEFKIVVENQDKTPEEFESTDLKREKIVGGGSKINVNINALKPGEYKFFGDFHQDSAQGKVIAE